MSINLKLTIFIKCYSYEKLLDCVLVKLKLHLTLFIRRWPVKISKKVSNTSTLLSCVFCLFSIVCIWDQPLKGWVFYNNQKKLTGIKGHLVTKRAFLKRSLTWLREDHPYWKRHMERCTWSPHIINYKPSSQKVMSSLKLQR